MSRSPASTVLILRFSALGDIAMTAPVVRGYAQANPHIHFIMASAPMLEPLFTGIPNLQFEGIDTKAYNGFLGIFRLFNRLRRFKPSLLLDLHQVLRTYALCALFFLGGHTRIFAVKKGRRQRRQLTRAKHKRLHPLPSMISNYTNVYVRSGFLPFPINPLPLNKRERVEGSSFYRIGIAPFAKHETKEWPVERMEQLVSRLSQNGKYHLSLFGGGAAERSILKGWEQRYPNTVCVAGSVDFAQEIALMGTLDLMVTMDSANMHFASFMEVPVISIWGGTHPFAGFYGWRQHPDNAVQVEMACRPCSVFGNKPCRCGTLACLQAISVEHVFQKINLFY